MPKGKIIVLNGPSSAGKTTLARAVRDARAPMACVISIDDFYPFVARAHPIDWHLFAALTESVLAATAVFANRGFDVIVDTVFERPECQAMAKSTLHGHDYAIVAVTCSLPVLEARERARGNRQAGQAREQFERVVQNADRYDLVLDTSDSTVESCAERVLDLIRTSANR